MRKGTEKQNHGHFDFWPTHNVSREISNDCFDFKRFCLNWKSNTFEPELDIAFAFWPKSHTPRRRARKKQNEGHFFWLAISNDLFDNSKICNNKILKWEKYKAFKLNYDPLPGSLLKRSQPIMYSILWYLSCCQSCSLIYSLEIL